MIPPPNDPLGSPPIPIDESLQRQWESVTTMNIHRRKTNWNFYVQHCRQGNKAKVEWIEKFMRGEIAKYWLEQLAAEEAKKVRVVDVCTCQGGCEACCIKKG